MDLVFSLMSEGETSSSRDDMEAVDVVSSSKKEVDDSESVSDKVILSHRYVHEHIFIV